MRRGVSKRGCSGADTDEAVSGAAIRIAASARYNRMVGSKGKSLTPKCLGHGPATADRATDRSSRIFRVGGNTVPIRVIVVFAALFLLGTVGRARAEEFPQIVMQRGHAKFIQKIAFSLDGRWLASGGDDGFRVWDAETGRMLFGVDDERAVSDVAFSDDARYLVVGFRDVGVRAGVWDLSTRTQRTSVPSDGRAQTTCVAFIDADHIILASGNQLLRFNVNSGESGMLAQLQGVLNTFSAIATTRDHALLAAGTTNGAVQLVDLKTATAVKSIPAHAGEVSRLAFSDDGRWLASGGNLTLGKGDNSVKLWSIPDGAARATLSSLPLPKPLYGEADAGVSLLAFNRNGTHLVVGGQNFQIKEWDLANKAIDRVVRRDVHGTSMAVGPTGDLAIERVREHSIQLIRAGRELMLGGGSALSGLSMRSDRKVLALASEAGAVVVDTTTWLPVGVDTSYIVDGPRTVAFLDDTHVVGAQGDTFRIFDTLTGASKDVTCKGADGTVLAFSARQKTLVTAGESGKGVGTCDLASGRFRLFRNTGSEPVTTLVFNRRGDQLVSASWFEPVVRHWSSDGKLLHELHTEATVRDATFSPDNRLIATAASGAVGLFGPAGESSIRLWDASTGRLVRKFEGHPGGTLSLAFSTDGNTLASLGQDGTVKVWDIESGRILQSIAGFERGSVVFGPGGWLLVTSTNGGITAVDWAKGTIALFLAYDGEEWIASSPDGRFDGSSRGWKLVGWRTKSALNEVYPVEVGFRQFFTPGLAREILERHSLIRLSQTITDADLRRPTVKLSGPESSEQAPTPDRTISLTISVSDGGTGAQDVRLFRNGVLVKGWRQSLDLSAGSVRLTAEVPIKAGENVFTAYAFSRGDIKSDDSTWRVYGVSQLTRQGVLYVLPIGINVYQDRELNLRYAAADAIGIADAVKKQNARLSRFETIETVPLLNERATKANLFAAIGALAGSPHGSLVDVPGGERLHALQPEDAAVIYYAGHGSVNGDHFYLLPHDFVRGQRSTFDQSAISDLELADLLSTGTATGRFVLIFDACNSGQVLNAEDPRLGPMNSKGLAQLAYDKGMYVLAASQSFQAALETQQLGHGLLTYALIDGLTKASRPPAKYPIQDEDISAKWLLQYAARKVPELQRQNPRARLVPSSTTEVSDLQQPRLFFRDELDADDPLILAIDSRDVPLLPPPVPIK
jgi:WD40 repeat protein/uncharacterized caspase-like protein